MRVILARYGEIHLKGDNRYIFEDVLHKNISKVIGDDAKVNKIGGRYLINEFEPQLELTIIKRLQKNIRTNICKPS